MIFGAEGIYDVLTRRILQTYGEAPPGVVIIGNQIFRNFSGFFPVPVVWRLLVAAAFLGTLWLLWKKPATAVPLGALALSSLVLALLLRQRHPYFSAKYLIPMAPTVWLGIAAWPTLIRRRFPHFVAIGVFLVLVANNTANCLSSTSSCHAYFDFFTCEQLNKIRSQVRSEDKLVYYPDYAACVGRFYGIPATQEISREEVLTSNMSQGDRQRVTWFIAGHVTNSKNLEEAKALLQLVAARYGLKSDPANVETHFGVNRFTAVRISPDGLSYISAGL